MRQVYLHLTTTTTINFKSIDCSETRPALQIQFHNNGASSSSLVFSFPLHFTFSQVWPGLHWVENITCGIFGPGLWPSGLTTQLESSPSSSLDNDIPQEDITRSWNRSRSRMPQPEWHKFWLEISPLLFTEMPHIEAPGNQLMWFAV